MHVTTRSAVGVLILLCSGACESEELPGPIECDPAANKPPSAGSPCDVRGELCDHPQRRECPVVCNDNHTWTEACAGCPVDLPVEGTVCDPSGYTGSCVYGGTCDGLGGAEFIAQCMGEGAHGLWTVGPDCS